MSQDLRLYSLALMIVLMLWVAPVRADYGAGSGCPTLAIPIQLDDDDIWHAGDDENGNWVDYRDLHPYNTSASVSGDVGDADCELLADAGTYYDGANHLWVLEGSLTCGFMNSGEDGDFRAGQEY